VRYDRSAFPLQARFGRQRCAQAIRGAALPLVASLHQLDAIFSIFGASDRDKRLILQS